MGAVAARGLTAFALFRLFLLGAFAHSRETVFALFAANTVVEVWCFCLRVAPLAVEPPSTLETALPTRMALLPVMIISPLRTASHRRVALMLLLPEILIVIRTRLTRLRIRRATSLPTSFACLITRNAVFILAPPGRVERIARITALLTGSYACYLITLHVRGLTKA